jgi:hypothetical protein
MYPSIALRAVTRESPGPKHEAEPKDSARRAVAISGRQTDTTLRPGTRSKVPQVGRGHIHAVAQGRCGDPEIVGADRVARARWTPCRSSLAVITLIARSWCRLRGPGDWTASLASTGTEVSIKTAKVLTQSCGTACSVPIAV